MAAETTLAHIEAQRRLRLLVRRAVENAWGSLPGYDAANVDEWVSLVYPTVRAGQLASVRLTEGYIARMLGRRPPGLPADRLVGTAVRRGAPAPDEVWRRPFVTLWTKLGDGVEFADASAAAAARASGMAAWDVQASMREASAAFQEADEGFYGYTRVADGDACDFCSEVDGAYVKDAGAMALHNGCGCGLEPNDEPHPRAVNLPSGVAVHEHGELGPVLTDSAHDFTTL